MLKRFYTAVVHRRRAVLAAFVLAAVLSVFASRAVQVDYDINDYLPPDSPSTIALEQMNSAFTGGIPNMRVMVRDVTVPQAAEVFAKCEHTRARYWGFKEAGLPFAEMRDLFARMKACGKQTCLEVVAYTEAECLRGAEMAAACGCDFLLGTVFSEAVNAYCRAHGLRYMPFVGQVTGRPSVLEGTAEEMVCEAKRCLAQGAYGIDLLGYRYTGDAPALNRALTAAVGPVCIAGSVNSYARLAEIRAAGAAYFTIGSAFFDHVFGDDFAAQIDAVCAYMEADHA